MLIKQILNELFNDNFLRWEKKNPGPGREELTAMQALDLLVNSFDVIAVSLSLCSDIKDQKLPHLELSRPAQVPLGNAHLPPLEAEAGAAAAGPACLTMTGGGYNQAYICHFLIFRHFEL